MSDWLDRSLEDMRHDPDVEGTEMDSPEDRAEKAELEEFGRLLGQGYSLSGQGPSLAAVEMASRGASLPPDTEDSIQRFHEGVRERIEKQLATRTGASSVWEWIRRARQSAALSDQEAADAAGLPLPAYRQLERGRIPVWNTQPRKFAAFCLRVSLDGLLLLRWLSLTPNRQEGAFGRLDLDDEDRVVALERVAWEDEQAADRERESWRREFMAAYAPSSGADAPSEQ
jgi:transcriptional regulator with XRE-family HTH domain